MGARYHSGCSVIDRLELLAQRRAEELFNTRRAWVQPLSGSLANLIVLTSLFSKRLREPSNVRILSMGLNQGWHLSHGTKAHISGMLFPAVRQYHVGRNSGLLDYTSIEAEALDWQPDLLFAGRAPTRGPSTLPPWAQ